MLGQLVPCGGGKTLSLAKTRLVLCSRPSPAEAAARESQVELLFADGYWSIRRLAEDATLRINEVACPDGRLQPNDILTVGRHRYRIVYTAPSTTTAAAPPPVMPAPSPTLQTLGVLVPCGGGPSIPMRKPKVVIGRAPTCDVVLPQRVVSSRHCALEYVSGYWQVADLDSHNGTFVDGVSYRQKWLFPGNVLGVVSNRYRVEYQPQGETPSAKDDDIPVLSRRSLMGSVGLTEKRLDRALKAEPVPEDEPRKRWKIDDE